MKPPIPLNPTFFEHQEAFRAWLAHNHRDATELIVGFYKVKSGKPSLTWSESVDQALCFGWIDGVRRSIDEQSYCIRFTPRRADSIWSTINIQKVEALTRAGLMRPEGIRAFSLRKEERSEVYSHEQGTVELSSEYADRFKENSAAWDFFVAQAPSCRRATIHWIMSAKQEKTRWSRLEKAITASAQHQRL